MADDDQGWRDAPAEPEPESVQLERIRSHERIEKRRLLVDLVGRVSPHLFPAIGLLGIAYFTRWAIVESAPYFAGRETELTLGAWLSTGFVSHLPIWFAAIGAAFGIGGLRVARREKRLRQREAERLGGDLRDEQKKRDPNRESSGYTPIARAAEDEA